MDRLTERGSNGVAECKLDGEGLVLNQLMKWVERAVPALAAYEEMFERWGLGDLSADELEQWHERVILSVEETNRLDTLFRNVTLNQIFEWKKACDERRLFVGRFPIGSEVWAVDNRVLIHGTVHGVTCISEPMSLIAGCDAVNEWGWYYDRFIFGSSEDAMVYIRSREAASKC